MSARDYSRGNQPKFPERNDSLPHQIRHLQYNGNNRGLGITVGCACTTGPLIPRGITSEEDGWEIYHAHLEEIDRKNGT